MKDRHNRVMVLGLDGISPNILNTFARQGIMPNIKRMMDYGVTGPLSSVIPPSTGPAWTSFLTGQHPEKHGIFDFVDRKAGQMYPRPVNYTNIKSPTLLSIVGHRENREVCAFNVPVTFPPPSINGIVVSGMQTPDTSVQFTHPAHLKGEIEAKYGPYMLDVFWHGYSDATANRFLRQLIAYEEQKIAIAKDLLLRRPWDLFIAVFMGTDRIQHALWHIIEAIVEDRKLGSKEEKLKGPVESYYRLIDEAIGEIIESAGENTTIFVMSDHGFGPLKKEFYINAWLRQEGLLAFNLKEARRISRNFSFRRALRQQLMRFPPINKYFRSKRVKFPMRGRMHSYWFLGLIDWSQTKAYSASPTEQGIYINLQGREPYGTVQPGQEYEHVRNHIIDRLKNLSDPADGEPLVSHIVKKEDVYQGPHTENAPDLLFALRQGEYATDTRLCDYLWEETSWITGRGAHRLDGVFLAYGRGIRKGEKTALHITDIAPTVLYVLDIPIPQEIDGKIPLSVFEEAFIAERPPRIDKSADLTAQSKEFSLSDEEEQKIFQNLEDLGYL
jgi:predicted AlkP superfamily phosphohydrolase/phosphomutase